MVEAIISSILNQNEEAGLRNWLEGKTNLKNIEDYRLEELIYKDLKAYPNSGFSEIHSRIGMEINMHKVRRIIKKMVDNHSIKSVGVNRWAKYSIE